MPGELGISGGTATNERQRIMGKSYRTAVEADIEAVSNARLLGWENEIIHSLENGQALSEQSEHFIKNPSYGDGGTASAVRIVSNKL